MKTFKPILIFSLCILAFSSCKNENDLGGNDIDTISTGKVAFERFGMKVYFPENEWKYETSTMNMPGFEGECVNAYLQKSGVVIENETKYSVYISFIRFVSTFEDDAAANKMIDEIKEIYDFWATVEEKKEYLSVEPITSSQIGNYPAKKMVCKKTNGSIEESYFIYKGKRLYWIAVIMPEDKKSSYYAECMRIINTLEITDK